VINAGLSTNSSFAHTAFFFADSSLAHSVLLTESTVLQILSEVLGKLTCLIGIFVVDLRALLVNVVVIIILVLGGYPSELALLQVTHLIKRAKVSIDKLHWGRL
jgi:hypothetical protein